MEHFHYSFFILPGISYETGASKLGYNTGSINVPGFRRGRLVDATITNKLKEAHMDKYIGFDMDSKKIVCCIVQADRKDRYMTINSDIESMRKFLRSEKQDGSRVEVVFEISGQAGFIYDSLMDYADKIKVANPSKMALIYRTAKKNDRIDAQKMAVL